MKRTVFIIAIISLLSCSKNEVEDINPLKEKLVGSWRFVGYFHYDIDYPDGELFYPVENGSIITYTNQNTFESYLNNTLNAQGSYTITLDSLLYHYTNSINGQTQNVDKITKLTSNVLEIGPAVNDIGIDNNLSMSRYEKVTTP